MGYRLYTDVCSDLPLDYIQQHDLGIVPMTVTVDGTEYPITADPADPAGIKSSLFYNKLRMGVAAKTAQVTSMSFIDVFSPVLACGDDILYIAFSSGLSGTYDSACVAVRELAQRYPERKVLVVDSLCASLGLGLLVHLCVQKRDEGMALEQLALYAEDKKANVIHWFTVDDLSHLRRGGRISGAMAFVGTVLSVKPILDVDARGRLIPVDKVQGRKRSLKYLVDRLDAQGAKPIRDAVFLSHGDADEEAAYVASMIKDRFGVDVTIINPISPIIGCHSGPGTMALFFVGQDQRKAAT